MFRHIHFPFLFGGPVPFFGHHHCCHHHCHGHGCLGGCLTPFVVLGLLVFLFRML